MSAKPLSYYLASCVMLTIPILLWNGILAGRLPAAFQPKIFWADIAPVFRYGENISRFFVFLLMALMPFSLSTTRQKRGFVLYLVGVLCYFTSWLPLVYFPESSWSNTPFGYLAPACTPLLWLTGIFFIGNSFYFTISFKPWLFLVNVIVFILFHGTHTYIIYTRTENEIVAPAARSKGLSTAAAARIPAPAP